MTLCAIWAVRMDRDDRRHYHSLLIASFKLRDRVFSFFFGVCHRDIQRGRQCVQLAHRTVYHSHNENSVLHLRF